MIVTRSWLNEWIDLSGISTTELVKTFNAIGLEVERVKSYDIPKNIVFGKVLSCEKHPDADKLNVCQVDLGAEVKQIVCGASNVRAGLHVVVATIGAVMPNKMEIKPVKLRGVDSYGMICSATEIGLEDINKGIIELDESIGDFTLGKEVREHPLFSDDLIEIELTANRGDCLSVRGICRDLSAAYDRPLHSFKIEPTESKKGIGRILQLTHKKDLDANLCYKVIDLEGLEIPFLMQWRLAQIEEKGKNDIESLLTYFTHATGVILRAYRCDYFKTNEQEIAKMVVDVDKFHYTNILTEEKQKASIVGVCQDENSKVNFNNGTLFLEASYIAPDVISKLMFEHKMKADDTFYKTSRGSEPDLKMGIDFVLEFLLKHSASSLYSGSVEVGNGYKQKRVSISKQEMDEIIGAKIDKVVISKILTNLGFDIAKSSQDSFVIGVPQYRHDIVNKQDIVEEIVRLVGIDNIQAKPFVFEEQNRLEDNYFTYKKKRDFRHRAAQSGFFETIHFVFDEKEIVEKYGFKTLESQFEIVNPIVKTLDTLRPTLLTWLLRSASHNRKNGYLSIRLFEIGSIFSPKREESQKIAFLWSGERELDSLLNSGKPQNIDFGFFVQKITDVIGEFELKQKKTTHSLAHDYQSADVIINGEVIGELFRVHPNVEKEYDLDSTYMCEIDFEKIPYGLKTATKKSKYQAVFRDLSLLVSKEVSYETIKQVIASLDLKDLVRFYPYDKYSDENLGENISLSLRFVLQSDEKTLEEEDITSIMDTILTALKTELGIGLR